MHRTEFKAGMRSALCMTRKVRSLYEEGHTAYWLPPLVLAGEKGPIGRVKSGDSVIFCCRRGEREIQLTRAFVDKEFAEFPRERLDPLTFIPLTLYHPNFRHLPVAFPPQHIQETLGEVVSRHGLGQLRLAEKEKQPHVTYFFNGGRMNPFPGEVDRCVDSFLEDPPRALPLLVNALKEELAERETAFVLLNLATGDLMGHSTKIEPKIHCAEAVDQALQAILDLAREHNYWVAITADHGLLEDHGPPAGPPNHSHTTHAVPFVLVGGASGESPPLAPEGILGDVAPTLLALLDLPRPSAMSGRSLLQTEEGKVAKVLLIILDGWGIGEPGHINPIELANTPCWDAISRRPMAHLGASGQAVGLLPGFRGNSESGHMNLGAGRVVLQDEVRIQQAIDSGTFAENASFNQAIEDARHRGGALHLLGFLSQKSSHGSINYVLELLKLARRKEFEQVYVHLITGGPHLLTEERSDLPDPDGASSLLPKAGKEMARIGVGTVVTVVGRGLALDRGGSYETKTRPAYEALVLGKGIEVRLT